MSEFTTNEIDEIVKAMSQKPPTKDETTKIPLRPPANFASKVILSPLEGEKPRPLSEVTAKEIADFGNLTIKVEVIFGKTKLTLKELAALKEESLIIFEELCDDLVDLYVNGVKIGRGEIVFVDGQFGVKILSFTKN